MRLRRKIGLVLVAIPVVLVAGSWIASRTGVLDAFVRDRILAVLRGALPGTRIEIASVGGTVGHSLVVHDLRAAVDGRTVVSIPRLDVVYDPLALLHGRLELEHVVLTAPRVRAVEEDGRWRLPQPSTNPGNSREGLGLHVGRLEVHEGRLAIARHGVEGTRRIAFASIGLEAEATLEAGRTTLALHALHAVPRGIALTPIEAAGTIVAVGDAFHLADLHVATARSRLEVGGRIAPGDEADLRGTLAVAARELRALVPTVDARTDVRARVRAAGPWRHLAVGVDVDAERAGRVRGGGRLDLGATPIAWGARLDFADLDPEAALPGLVRARATGRLRARGRGVGETAPITYRVVLGRSVIADQAFTTLELHGVGRSGTHHVRAALAATPGDATVRARVTLATPLRYRLDGRVRAGHADAHATVHVAARGEGIEPPGRYVDARVVVQDAVLPGVHLTRGLVPLRLDDTRLAIGPGEVGGPGVWATVTGNADLAARTLEAALSAGADRTAAPADAARIDATVRGSFAALAVQATAGADALAWGGARAERADARVDLRGLGGADPTGTLRGTAVGATLLGSEAHAVQIDADWRRVADTDRGNLTVAARAPDARAQRLALRLERGRQGAHGDLTQLLVTPAAGEPWQLAAPASFAIDDGIETDGLRLTAGPQQVSLRGRIALTGGTNAATIDVAHLRLKPICELVDGPSCAGEASMQARLGGTAASPRFDATLAAERVRVEELPYGRLDGTLAYADTSATVRADLNHPRAGTLHLEGNLPVDLAWAGPHRDLTNASVLLAAQASALDLTFVRVFAPREIRGAAGSLSLDARLSGPWRALRADGTLTVTGGRLELASAGIPYEEIQIEARAVGRTIEVTTLRARAGDGTLEGGGHLDLDGARAIELETHLQEFYALRRSSYEGVVSGDVRIGGTLGAPAITGTLDVERLLLRPTGLPGSTPKLERDQSIVVIGGPPPPAPPPPSPGSKLLDPLRIDLTIRIERNAFLRRIDANVELGGALRLEKAPGEQLRITGRIELRRGWYAFQGRRFTLDEGRIIFTGNVPPDPSFAIAASYTARDYRVIVHIGGTASKPTLTLLSEPPLEQSDILSVLLFGKPTAELGQGQSVGLQRQAVEIATGYVAPDLQQSVMNSLGLDALDVSVPQDATTPGRVAVGRYVTGDVFVSLAQEFGAQQAEVVSLEYSLTRRFSVRASTSTRGASAIDAFWHRRY
jgi:TamB, inner membrane protein subunit of TAM complex